jgi:fatty acid desaturase
MPGEALAVRQEAPPAADPVVDVAAFTRDLDALRKEIDAKLGPDDLSHLKRFALAARISALLGYATAWIVPNPISAFLIALGNFVRWAVVMHHVGHRGYDRVPGVPLRYTSRAFASRKRRLFDWLDWMWPEAWRYEHNVLHHGHTGELDDPDLVEEYVDWMRRSKMPLVFKYGVIAFFAIHWKVSYYAPNTFQAWTRAEKRRRGEPTEALTITNAFDPRTKNGRAFWRACLLPYALVRFVLLPLVFLPLGPWAAMSVLANSLLAELIANVHSFFMIVPNHAGDDLFRFDGRAQDRGTFYVRQVIGSVNYTSSGAIGDFLQGGLNYQIEHHLFPDLPLLKYRQYRPRVKAICEAHGIPYIEERLFRRVGKLIDIILGKTSMRRG